MFKPYSTFNFNFKLDSVSILKKNMGKGMVQLKKKLFFFSHVLKKV